MRKRNRQNSSFFRSKMTKIFQNDKSNGKCNYVFTK